MDATRSHSHSWATERRTMPRPRPRCVRAQAKTGPRRHETQRCDGTGRHVVCEVVGSSGGSNGRCDWWLFVGIRACLMLVADVVCRGSFEWVTIVVLAGIIIGRFVATTQPPPARASQRLPPIGRQSARTGALKSNMRTGGRGRNSRGLHWQCQLPPPDTAGNLAGGP
jgi:hypothetical protein